MLLSRWRSRRRACKSYLWSLAWLRCRWRRWIHFYIFLVVILVAGVISYRQPFGLLFNIRYLQYGEAALRSVRDQLIQQHKHEQHIAYQWLENVLTHPNEYPNLISNETQQSRFFDYVRLPTSRSSSSYQLLTGPKQRSPAISEPILISVLYSRQDTDHREGKFYIGQVLYHLLKHHHSRFLITLCENNNTREMIPEGIKLIRRLVPVFIVNSVSNSSINNYEREKQAHVQCILANFQSFPSVQHLLLLQDDAEPISEHFYLQLLALIDVRIKQQWPVDGERPLPAFIKIYHPRWLIDYFHPSLYMILQLLSSSFLITFVGFAAVYRYELAVQVSEDSRNDVPFIRSCVLQGKEKTRKLHSHQLYWQAVTSPSLSNTMQYVSALVHQHHRPVYFTLYYLLVTLVLLLLNHSNISWPWRSLHPSFYAIYPAPSCCLPGVLYFRQTYVQVLDYLQRIQCHSRYAIDTAYDDLPTRTHLQTFLVEPNLVHHIGLYSRLRRMYINPYLLD